MSETSASSQESEARFRNLIRLSADWYWEQDDRFRFTFLSTEVATKSRFAASASVGCTRWDHPGVDLASADWEAHKAACRAHQSFRDFTYRRHGEDGSVRWIAVSGEPVFDASGRFQGYRGVGRDVTEQKRAEQEIIRRRDLYAALSETNRAIIHIHEPEALFVDVCRVAVDYGHLCLAWIGLLDDETGWIQPMAVRGPASRDYSSIRVLIDPRLPEGHGFTAAALREGRHYIVNDFLADPRTAPWAEQARATGVKSLATFPLKRDGRSIGVLNLCGDEVGFFSDELVALLEEMALNLSFALENLEHEARRVAAEAALRENNERLQQINRELGDALVPGAAEWPRQGGCESPSRNGC